MIIFEEGKEDEKIERGDLDKTMLLAYFKLNREDPEAREYFYSEIPKSLCLLQRWMEGKTKIQHQNNY